MVSAERLRREDWRVLPVSLRTARRLVAQYHYARNGSNTATFTHGLFHRSNYLDCLGAAWWLPPTRSTAEASWEGDWQAVLNLSRLVIAPEVPVNGASFLLGESIRLIRRDGRFHCLVTYADTWRGHTGAIYRATNWQYMGLTAPEATWVETESRRLIARKAGPHTRTAAEMQALGCEMVGRFAKHKYRMILRQPTTTPTARTLPVLAV